MNLGVKTITAVIHHISVYIICDHIRCVVIGKAAIGSFYVCVVTLQLTIFIWEVRRAERLAWPAWRMRPRRVQPGAAALRGAHSSTGSVSASPPYWAWPPARTRPRRPPPEPSVWTICLSRHRDVRRERNNPPRPPRTNNHRSYCYMCFCVYPRYTLADTRDR